MAIILDSELSSETANSYVTVAEADSYFENHYNSTFTTTWDGLETGQKELLLISGTAAIDAFRFTEPVSRDNLELHYSRVTGVVSYYTTTETPVRYNAFQNLQFPRNIDILVETSEPYIPEAIKMSVFEQAISIKNFSLTGSTTNSKIMQGIKSEEVEIAGQIRRAITYQDGGSSGVTETNIFTSTLSPIAYQLISPFILRGSRTRRQ